jgi:hypothetical protein
MSYYRIDRRDFAIGDIIRANAAFINNINAARTEIEDLLEMNRPAAKPNRNEIVKLFDSFSAAKKYWILDTDSKFYEVEIAEDDILHRGNYPLVESLALETDGEIKNAIAMQYWNQEVADDAEDVVVENYVNQATVIRIVCNDEEVRKNTKRAYYKLETMKNVEILQDE